VENRSGKSTQIINHLFANFGQKRTDAIPM